MVASNHTTDATVLLTGAHVDLLVDALRSVRVVMQQLEASNRRLDESQREQIKAQREQTKAMHELTAELKKRRKRG